MKTKVKWDNLIKLASGIQSNHPEIRYGQSLMIALNNLDMGIYEEICNTEADCFYDDSKCMEFFTEVSTRWEEST